jgi:hypothetical protein
VDILSRICIKCFDNCSVIGRNEPCP